MHSVLFVCAENICRSPMAMGLMRSIVPEPEVWRIESAGVWARKAYPAHKMVQDILYEKGIDLSQHRSRGLSREILNQFDLVLVMEIGQKEGIRAAYPEFAQKVFLLSEMSDQRHDIVDPINGDMIDFIDTAREIEHILTEGFSRIRKLASRDTLISNE